MHQRKVHRVKTPVRFQVEARECGAVALGIILAYYGKHLSIQELRDACGTSREGIVLGNMVRAARQYGLEVTAHRHIAPKELIGYTAPFIIFWNFNHFLVVEGVNEAKIYVNDPAVGPYQLDLDREFNEKFTGIIITLTPTSDFVPGGSPPRLWIRLVRYLCQKPIIVSFYIIVYLLKFIADLALILAGGSLVDSTLFSRQPLQPQDYLFVGVLLLGYVALHTGTAFVQTRLKSIFTTESKLFEEMLASPIKFFTSRYVDEVVDRVTGAGQISETLLDNWLPILLNMIWVLLALMAMLVLDRGLFAFSVGLIVIQAGLLAYTSTRLYTADQQIAKELSIFRRKSTRALKHIETLYATDDESLAFMQQMHYLAKAYTAEQRYLVQPRQFELWSAFFAILGQIVFFLFSTTQIHTGKLITAQLLMLITSIRLQAIRNWQIIWERLREQVANLDDALPIPGEHHPIIQTQDRGQGVIEVRNVTFGYDSNRPAIIQNLSFTTEPGKITGLVGSSGCGKSTLLYLIAGLYIPWSGEILLDGYPIHRQLHDNGGLRLVEATPILFPGTVRQNITLFRDNYSEQHILQAAHEARIHEAIMARQVEYDYWLDDRTRHFSEGEQQRLMIARALLDKPRILLLDEATHAISDTLEHEIIGGFRQAALTCILTTHFLRTTHECSEILVMETGQIVERGNPQALEKNSSLYRQLMGLDVPSSQ